MSFLDKQRYEFVDIRYDRQDQVGTFYMSQFPTNDEVFEAMVKNYFISSYSQPDEFLFKRINDNWYKPRIEVFSLEDSYPKLYWEIRPC